MKVIYTKTSIRDLRQIWNYIAKESASAEVADRYIRRIFDACDELESSAESYAPFRYAPKYQMVPFEKYLILFCVRDNEVKIGRVRHSSRKPFRGR